MDPRTSCKKCDPHGLCLKPQTSYSEMGGRSGEAPEACRPAGETGMCDTVSNKREPA